MSPCAIAIDQGTTSTRALVLDEDGTGRIVAARRHAQSHPGPGRVEHDPRELLANIRACLGEAAAATGGASLPVGLANQGESCLAWDAATGEPLSPVIVWQDGRTGDRVAALKAEGREPEVLARAGLPLDPYFSATKLAWLLETVPEVGAAHRAGRLRLGTTDAFFLRHLTGADATDATTASRTSLMAVATGAWDERLCALFGVPIETLPPIRPTVFDLGRAGPHRLAASIVDQQAALYGHGCRRPGDAKVTFGTGAFMLAVTGETIVRAPDQGLLPTVAWRIGERTTYAVDGGVYDAGSAIDWVRSLGLFGDVAELDAFAAPPAIERGLAFVPALSGLACPHWDRSGAALWIGMDGATGPRDLVQAALEGVALRTAEVVAAIDSRMPLGEALSVDGGLAQSDYFVQVLADAIERPVLRPAFHELTALGAARLACGDDAPSAAAGDARRVLPRGGGGARWREMFAGAVARSRGWR